MTSGDKRDPDEWIREGIRRRANLEEPRFEHNIMPEVEWRRQHRLRAVTIVATIAIALLGMLIASRIFSTADHPSPEVTTSHTP